MPLPNWDHGLYDFSHDYTDIGARIRHLWVPNRRVWEGYRVWVGRTGKMDLILGEYIPDVRRRTTRRRSVPDVARSEVNSPQLPGGCLKPPSANPGTAPRIDRTDLRSVSADSRQ